MQIDKIEWFIVISKCVIYTIQLELVRPLN